MIRELQVVANKPITLITTSEAMKRGAVIVEDYKTETVKNATSGATDIYFVDVEPTYEGINAVVEPTDGNWENIEAKAEVKKIPLFVGERYATTELVENFGTALAKGDYLKADGGKFVKGENGDVCIAVYMGEYADPTGLSMGIVQITRPFTVA